MNIFRNDLTGKRFGRLLAIKYLEKGKWECQCECGNITQVRGNALRTGYTKSCGCLQREMSRNSHIKHGLTTHIKQPRLYGVWKNMRSRCNNQNNRSYHRYGGRGIDICEEWNRFENFYKWAIDSGYDENHDMGDYTIDRIDNNKGYSPENCRWVNMSIQSLNRNKYEKPSQWRAVICIDKNGEEISVYKSIKDAESKTGICHIGDVCREKRKTAGGYKWRYAEQ